MFSYSDLVFYSSLLVCISLGGFYKSIDNPVTKRNYGTGLGILITCLLCGTSIIHSILMVCGNIVIIKCGNKLYIHHLSLAYTWLFLIYMTYSPDFTRYMLWVHQAIALRLVGLAFELTMADKNKRRKALTTSTSMTSLTGFQETGARRWSNIIQGPEMPLNSKIKTGDAASDFEPSAVDIISYAYYFIGLHKGPYYRFKVFNEHFKTSFGMLGNCRIITEHKLRKAFFFSLCYMLLTMQFPVQVYYEKDFYYSHSTDFRYLYNIPQILRYVLQYEVLMMLCTSVCTEAGFGVYPTKTVPLPGYGPTTRLSLLNVAEIRL